MKLYLLCALLAVSAGIALYQLILTDRTMFLAFDRAARSGTFRHLLWLIPVLCLLPAALFLYDYLRGSLVPGTAAGRFSRMGARVLESGIYGTSPDVRCSLDALYRGVKLHYAEYEDYGRYRRMSPCSVMMAHHVRPLGLGLRCVSGTAADLVSVAAPPTAVSRRKAEAAGIPGPIAICEAVDRAGAEELMKTVAARLADLAGRTKGVPAYLVVLDDEKVALWCEGHHFPSRETVDALCGASAAAAGTIIKKA